MAYLLFPTLNIDECQDTPFLSLIAELFCVYFTSLPALLKSCSLCSCLVTILCEYIADIPNCLSVFLKNAPFCSYIKHILGEEITF